jgi:hypothetical protein
MTIEEEELLSRLDADAHGSLAYVTGTAIENVYLVLCGMVRDARSSTQSLGPEGCAYLAGYADALATLMNPDQVGEWEGYGPAWFLAE